MRAQVASESLIILGFIVILLVPLLFYFIFLSSEKISSITEYQVLSLINQICDNAAEVWYQGQGAKKSTVVFFPLGITNIMLGGDAIFQSFDVTQRQLDKRKILIETEFFNKKKSFFDYCAAPIKNIHHQVMTIPEASLNYKPGSNDVYLPSGVITLNFEYVSVGLNGEVNKGDYILVTRGRG